MLDMDSVIGKFLTEDFADSLQTFFVIFGEL